ncbi:type II toxin-antitoxin system VapB family antitoxin [Nocardia sp. NPDC058640]|uniref:type II toxin-antitoxin system VapB family antitoxin n=1 Tax=Nocardia sp. NPDC058640 TaxID=3346571 RepID=UPI00364873B5
MTITQIDLDDDALQRVMATSRAETASEAVNLALRAYATAHERATRAEKHFERAAQWGAVEDAERRHRAEKNAQ